MTWHRLSVSRPSMFKRSLYDNFRDHVFLLIKNLWTDSILLHTKDRWYVRHSSSILRVYKDRKQVLTSDAVDKNLPLGQLLF